MPVFRMRVDEIMSTNAVTVDQRESTSEAWSRMRRGSIRHLVVAKTVGSVASSRSAISAVAAVPFVDDHGLRQWSSGKQPIQNPAHPGTPNGDVDFNHRHLFRPRIGHRQTPEPPPRHESIMGKVHRITEPGSGRAR